MRKLFYLLTFPLLALSAVSVQAQKFKLPRVSSAVKSASRSLPRTNISVPKVTASVQRAQLSLPHAIKKLAPHSPDMVPALNAPIRSSVWPLQEQVENMFGEPPLTASSFVIEEEFEGEKHLWGVTAAHIATLMRAAPGLMLENTILTLPIEFTAMGSAGMVDLALFPLDDMKEVVTPLQLAGEPLLPGERTYSFGFFDNDFFLVPNRTMQEITPGRIITSLEFNTKDRAGACGGPLLNKNGEVIGVHIGSSDSEGVSFAVPASEIKRLLKAYRNNGKALKPLVFNGKVIGQININEHIEKLRAFTGEHMEEFITWHKEKEVDYRQLETLLNEKNPDQLQIFISHKPFSFNGEDSEFYTIRLTYDVKRGSVSYETVPATPY